MCRFSRGNTKRLIGDVFVPVLKNSLPIHDIAIAHANVSLTMLKLCLNIRYIRCGYLIQMLSFLVYTTFYLIILLFMSTQ
jgi:hypothetical protein